MLDHESVGRHYSMESLTVMSRLLILVLKKIQMEKAVLLDNSPTPRMSI